MGSADGVEHDSFGVLAVTINGFCRLFSQKIWGVL
jgi:hypothetical protein